MDLDGHEQSLAHVADVMRHHGPTALLIGAGCSVKAGIPTANGFAQLIRSNYESIEGEGYAECMTRLTDAQQKSLIQEQISNADINWAHVAISQLIADTIVERVLTTNFDPLVLRACAMNGLFPAVYDYAAAPGVFNESTVSDPSVFHLHGQGSGFVLKNSEDEMAELAASLPPLLNDTLRNRPLLVIGYSGRDPVFEKLVEQREFPHGLYWVTYDNADPAEHVREELIASHDNTSFVRGTNADIFLIRLARALECFPPPFIDEPFSHQSSLLNSLSDFPSVSSERTHTTSDAGIMLGGEGEEDILEQARRQIQKAIDQFETGIEARVNRARSLLVEGKHAELDILWESCDDTERSHIAQLYSRSLYERVHERHLLARKNFAAVSPDALQRIEDMYGRILEINPTYSRALRAYGALQWEMAQAGIEDPLELWDEAIDKFKQAVDIDPEDHLALYNWGLLLQRKFEQGHPSATTVALDNAIDKYRRALDIKSDFPEALYNWGNALLTTAKSAPLDARDDFLKKAVDRFRRAIELQPNKVEAFENWGEALFQMSLTRSDEEANQLLDEAVEKYRYAHKINTNNPRVLYNWGVALTRKAQHFSGSEAISLLDEAIDKYSRAVELKPDKAKALNNWGMALNDKAKYIENESKARRVREEAETKFERARAAINDK